MNRQVVLRLLDTFFRHFWLYLVPVIALGAVGIWTATSAEDDYHSFGTMKVENTAVVAELTGIQQDSGFGWQTPAAATADSFNALLRTQTFAEDVVQHAGLQEAFDTGAITADQVRSSIVVYPDSSRLVKVQATNQFPDVTYRLANGAMQAYIEAVIASEASNGRVAVEFLQQKLPDYRAGVADAEAALREWLAANPGPEAGDRPEDEQVELQQLQDTITNRQEQLREAQRGIEQAQLSVEQKSAEVKQRLQVIDPPQRPVAPQPKMKKAVLTVGMALLVGCFIAVAGVVIGTLLDRTIRFPGDVKERLGTRVLAVVPRTRLTTAVRKQLDAPDEPTPAVVPVPSEVTEIPSANEVDVEAGASEVPVSLALADENGSHESQPPDGASESAQEPVDARAGVTLKRVPSGGQR